MNKNNKTVFVNKLAADVTLYFGPLLCSNWPLVHSVTVIKRVKEKSFSHRAFVAYCFKLVLHSFQQQPDKP